MELFICAFLVYTVREAPRLELLLEGFDHAASLLGLSLAADGVDTLDQLDVVRRLGLPYAQGNALYPPHSLKELERIETIERSTAIADQ